ncbi:MAG: RNA-binding protein [Chloracidobacterium sp. CP2_5A]|nr:MAG: RNA-binding protein [Chloracidobacterium sp. CP2_5A]
MTEHIARALADAPEAVSASVEAHGNALAVKLKVDPADVGKIIGRHGRTITAMRSLLSAVGATISRRVSLEVVE